MKTIFIVAMKYELENIFNIENLILEDGTFPKYSADNFSIIISGIGKTNAAACTQYIISKMQPKEIINVGTSAALNKSLAIGQICSISSTKFHDVDVTAFGYELGQIPQTDISHYTLSNHEDISHSVLTGDTFANSNQTIKFFKEIDSNALIDMELASIAHTCYINKKLDMLRSYKVISDYADANSNEDFYKNEQQAFKNIKNFIYENIINN